MEPNKAFLDCVRYIKIPTRDIKKLTTNFWSFEFEIWYMQAIRKGKIITNHEPAWFWLLNNPLTPPPGIIGLWNQINKPLSALNGPCQPNQYWPIIVKRSGIEPFIRLITVFFLKTLESKYFWNDQKK